MFSHYLRIALRTLMKSKVHTFINIFGLGFGLACVFLIALYVEAELSYDRFHDKPENLYRITWEDDNPQTRTPHPIAQAMKSDFPEVESAVSITPLYAAGLTRETHSLWNPERDVRYDETGIMAVDTTFFDVFTIPLVKGNPGTALRQVNGVLLSESMARKYFGDEDPIGQHLAVDEENYLVEVVGVFKDVPRNSHVHFDFLVSYLREKSFDQLDPFYSWADFGHYNYVRLRDKADVKALENKMMPWMRKYLTVSDADYRFLEDQGYRFRLQPVTDIHLKSALRWELEPNGNIEYVYLLSAAAVLTLVIACVNFMNLTTAKSAERAREIGVRKALGAGQRQLSSQFLSESVTMAIIAISFAILIVEVTLPFLNAFTGYSFAIQYGRHGLLVLALGVSIGALSGIYPSTYLSAVKPQLALRGQMIRSAGGVRFRKGLVVLQFFMCMILISSALIIHRQLDFVRRMDLGFGKEAVLVVPVKNESGLNRFGALQNELLKIDGVISVSASSNIPGGQFNQHHISSLAFPDDDIPASEVFVDYDFFTTMDITLSAGRSFMRSSVTDSGAVYVINETAARQLNLGDAVVGKEIWWKHREQNDMQRGTVIGIVEDFHFQSLHEPIRPLIFALTQKRFNHILIKIGTGNFSDRIAAIERIYKEFEPVYGFEFAFLEDRLDAQYTSEARTAAILGIFTVIAILIASLGLFGMSLLSFQQRMKELSVRKVLGATRANMLALLMGDLTKLILLAVGLAIPLTWWIMNKWLGNFSYQSGIHPLLFACSGLTLLLTSWVTLGYFTVRASRLNPAETLKNE